MRDDIPILPLYTDYTCYKVNWSRARVVIYVFRLSSILRMYSHTYTGLDDPVTRFHARSSRSSIKRLTYEMVFKLCRGGLLSRHFEFSLIPPPPRHDNHSNFRPFRPVNRGIGSGGRRRITGENRATSDDRATFGRSTDWTNRRYRKSIITGLKSQSCCLFLAFSFHSLRSSWSLSRSFPITSFKPAFPFG